MSLSIGIVGLPNVGKSTLFNALTDSTVIAANYPFATIEPNTGIVPVPDERLNMLAKIYKPSKVIPATVTFVDIAGLVSGAHKGEGLGNQFLSHIRSTSAIVHVVRAFDGPNVQHVDANRDPARDIETINTELILADLQTIDKHLPKLEKEAKANAKLLSKLSAIKDARQILDKGQPLSSGKNLDLKHLTDLFLLTTKPVIYVFNTNEAILADTAKQEILKSLVNPAPAVFICAKIEDELRSLDPEERQELLESFGQRSSGLEKLVKEAYKLLGLQSFLTAGEKEVRAWTISTGTTAPQAAGVIHGDFERGFIAAQVVDYNDLVEAGSVSAARSVGKVRTEGKDYLMQPNDIVEFRFNV